jgi:hypothetical protein
MTVRRPVARCCLPTGVLALALLHAAQAGAEGGFSGWSVDEEPIVNGEVRLRLTMLPIYAGGAGAARLVLLRRAEEIARANGCSEVLVLKYGEGIDSRFPFAQRYAEGVIRLIP